MRTTLLPRAERTPEPAVPPVTWSSRWETALDPLDHDAIAALLARSFTATAATFAPGRSWGGARPELRVLGLQDGEIVAHAGLVRRFLRAPDHDTSVLVGDVGLVAVHPGRQGQGLGGGLMAAVAAALEGLGMPYGFLTCDPELVPFYRRCGWTPLVEHPVRSIRVDQALEDHRRNGMLLPVHRPEAEWPSGRIERNGQEI